MAYLGLTEPPECAEVAAEARAIYLEAEAGDQALARSLALRHVVEKSAVTIEPDTLLLGGEDPFFFNLLLPALQADAHSREGQATARQWAAIPDSRADRRLDGREPRRRARRGRRDPLARPLSVVWTFA